MGGKMRYASSARWFARTGTGGIDSITGWRLDPRSDAHWHIGGRAGAAAATHDVSVTALGVMIIGTAGNDVIDAGSTVPGQPFPTTEDDIIYGLGGSDTIRGLGGNDVIDGGAGIDTLIGGMGNDFYVVDLRTDLVLENPDEGTDWVQASASFTLSPNIEHLVLAGAAIRGQGNAAPNILIGNAEGNVLSGHGGGDWLDGGLGSDTANYSASPAAVGVSLATGNGGGGDAHGDKLLNIENLAGSSFGDMLFGDSGDNTIMGGAGADLLVGDEGDDRLVGGPGADSLLGSAGADEFVFDNLGDLSLNSPNDLIRDFSSAELDTIDLSGIDANSIVAGNQAFTFIGVDGFTNQAGQLRYAATAGDLVLRGDVDGDGVADFSLGVLGTAALVTTDFVL